MISASKLVLVSLPFLAATLALPTGTCKPNFQGNKLTIYQPLGFGQELEWTPVNADTQGGHIALQQTTANTAFANGEFLVEFTGQADNSYNIKMTANTNLRLAGWEHGDLAFAPTTWDWSDKTQQFAIDCSVCTTTAADMGIDCVISHPATQLCVTGNTNGVALKLATCDSSSAQRYTIRRAN